ncbi:MAG TPA: hypothetical protein VMX17_08930 [Candidatus Glassbacteria bacterium]|nr:hypothetical protein [Candidatus Glassbacteria bacterium]
MLLEILEFISKKQDEVLARLDEVEKSLNETENSQRDRLSFDDRIGEVIERCVDNETIDYVTCMQATSHIEDDVEYEAERVIEETVDDEFKRNLVCQHDIQTYITKHDMRILINELTEEYIEQIQEQCNDPLFVKNGWHIVNNINNILNVSDNLKKIREFVDSKQSFGDDVKLLSAWIFAGLGLMKKGGDK